MSYPAQAEGLVNSTILGQSELGNNGNQGVFCISQSSSITEASPPNCLVSYPGHEFGEVLLLKRDAVGVFHIPCWLGKVMLVRNISKLIIVNALRKKKKKKEKKGK